MTGNKIAWRAPLAGLASLAMIATMGVVASTANAASYPDHTISFDKAGVNSNVSTITVKYGESAADALTRSNSNLAKGYPASSVTVVDSTKVFGGWYADGAPFDWNAPVTKDVTLKPVLLSKNKTGAAGNPDVTTTVVNFYTDSTPEDGTTSGTTLDRTIAVPAGSVISSAFFPEDKADGWALTGWTYQVADNTSVTGDATKALPKGAAEVNVYPTFEAGKTLTFVADNDTAGLSNALISNARFTFPSDSRTYQVDVKKGATFDPSTLKFFPNTDKYGLGSWTYASNATGKTDVPFTAATNIDDVKENTNISAKILQGKTVTFYDGDTKLFETTVVSGSKVTMPATPDRGDGSVFKGWSSTKDTYTPFDFNKAITADTDLYAWYVAGGTHTITFKYGYEGAPEDVKASYGAYEQTVRPEDPSREGYVFVGWYTDVNGNGVYDGADTAYAAWGNTLAENVTLVARWAQADQSVAEAALRYIDGSDKNIGKRFTASSFEAYQKSYQAVQKEYAKAVAEAEGKADKITPEQASKVVADLQAAWDKLVFKSNTDNTTSVYRFYNKVSSEHLYTSDVTEVSILKDTKDWQYEGKVFGTVKSDKDNAIAGLASFKNAAKGDSAVADALASIASPIVTNVWRLYNPVLGEHLYTTDAAEYDGLVSHDWSQEGVSFYAPKNGPKGVYRLYNPVLGEHLFTQSAAEANGLTAHDWSIEAIVFRAF